MLQEQERIANETKTFLDRWGLKAKYVAEVCGLTPKVLSQFINHRFALTNNQLNRLTTYIAEYEVRNG